MITGTIINQKPTATAFGREYQVQFDVNPEAKAASGQPGGAIAAPDFWFWKDDRVELEYRVGPSYGLWFIIRKIGGQNVSTQH